MPVCHAFVSTTQMMLLSQDYGKHLLGVQDLLQKHALVEADIGIQADRVKAVNNNAQKFAIDGDGENDLNIPTAIILIVNHIVCIIN